MAVAGELEALGMTVWGPGSVVGGYGGEEQGHGGAGGAGGGEDGLAGAGAAAAGGDAGGDVIFRAAEAASSNARTTLAEKRGCVDR
jgi:hypothetical protein